MTASERIRAARAASYTDECRELYFYDVHVSDAQYARIIEDAQARDNAAANVIHIDFGGTTL